MKLEHTSVEEFKRELLHILECYLDLEKYQVFFFGSRVTGCGDERSDIDVGILGKEPISDSVMGKIKNDVDEMRALYKVDVVDFASVQTDFKQVAMEKIEIIWPVEMKGKVL